MKLTMVLRTGLIFLIPATNIFGILVKKFKKENTLGFNITRVLFIFNFIGASIVGLVTSPYTGWRYWTDALVLCGFFQGLITAGIATFGYDVVMSMKGRRW